MHKSNIYHLLFADKVSTKKQVKKYYKEDASSERDKLKAIDDSKKRVR